ncbi:ATP-binding cassette domain-containing protein [Aerococcus vaginalis]
MKKDQVDQPSETNKKLTWSNVLIVIMLFIHAATMAIVSILMGVVIDAATNKTMDKFVLYIGISVALVIIGFLAQTWGYRLIYTNSGKKLLAVKNKLLKKDLVKDGWKNVDYSTNLDIVYANRYVAIFMSIDMVITLILSMFTLFSIDWRAVIIGVIGAMIPLLSPLLTQKRIRQNADNFAKKSQLFQRFTYEHLNIKDEINRYNVEDRVIDKYKDKSVVQEQARFKLENLMYFAQIFSSALGTVSVLAVLLLAGLMVFSGALSVGMMISVMQLTSSLVAPVIQLSNTKAIYESSRPIFNSFHFDQEYEFKAPEKLPNGDLEVKDIHFAYDEGPELFDGFTKTFEQGKKYLIRGESGRGKSTLAGIIAGEIEPDQGGVYFSGTKMNRENIKNRNIGYQNQANKIFTGTVFENINFYRGYDRDTIQAMRDSVHLKPGIDKTVELNHGLSGGEKTLVAVSRALMESRDVMIFDEPTTGLNDELSEMITKRILNLPSTVIMISHISDDEFSSQFDEVITLK